MGGREGKEEREVRRMTGERVTDRRRPAPARTGATWARPEGWRRLDPLLDPELRLCWGSGCDAREAALRLFLVVRHCGGRRSQRVGDDTCSWRSTHGFLHSSKCSGRIRPGPMREKTEYRDEPLEHAFMGCLRAGLRSLPEGEELGGEEEKKAACVVLAHAAARGRP